jgi:hypothetical protein
MADRLVDLADGHAPCDPAQPISASNLFEEAVYLPRVGRLIDQAAVAQTPQIVEVHLGRSQLALRGSLIDRDPQGLYGFTQSVEG